MIYQSDLQVKYFIWRPTWGKKYDGGNKVIEATGREEKRRAEQSAKNQQ